MRRLLYSLLLAVAVPLAAQSPPPAAFPPPPRPPLPAKADTNAAADYAELGEVRNLRPEVRVAAWYWAQRLDPENSKYRDGYFRALAAKQGTGWWDKYLEGDRKVVTSPEARRLDSIRYEILLRDPFVGIPPPALRCVVPSQVRDLRDPLQAAYAYRAFGCLEIAVDLMDAALAKYPKRVGIRFDRAMAYYAMRRYPEAVSQLNRLVEALEQRDSSRTVRVYETREVYLYMIGMIHRTVGEPDQARAAFQRALTENLGFAFAHVRIGEADMVQGDVAGALAEFEQAVQMREWDGLLHLQYGGALSNASRLEDAEAQMRRAVELLPDYASGHLLLATVLDQQKKGADAAAHYRDYVRLAPRADSALIDDARSRIAALAPVARP